MLFPEYGDSLEKNSQLSPAKRNDNTRVHSVVAAMLVVTSQNLHPSPSIVSG